MLHFEDAPLPLEFIRDEVLTVSPNRQYLGMATPMTPVTHEPVCMPAGRIHITVMLLFHHGSSKPEDDSVDFTA